MVVIVPASLQARVGGSEQLGTQEMLHRGGHLSWVLLDGQESDVFCWSLGEPSP